MKLNIKKEVQVEAKILKLYLKVVDGFTASLEDRDGVVLKAYEGYVPGFMPGEHYGDYVILDIDIDTGLITNWVRPIEEDIEAFIAGNQDE